MPDTNATPRANSTRFVWIGCKLPHGLTLELFDESTICREPGSSGFNIHAFRPPLVKGKVTLKGANSVRNDYSMRGLAQPQFPYGITQVPEDFWNAWLAQHGADDCVRGGFVFAVRKERDARSAARERESEQTGLEPLHQRIEADPRMPNQRNLPPEERVVADEERLASLNRQNEG